jgi:hypothetical protein
MGSRVGFVRYGSVGRAVAGAALIQPTAADDAEVAAPLAPPPRRAATMIAAIVSTETPPSVIHTSWSRHHRITCGCPRLNAAFERLDVGKPLRPEFGCLTGSTSFSRSSAVEDEFLCLRQRTHSGLKARQGDGPLQVDHPAFCLVIVGADEQSLVRGDPLMRVFHTDSLDVCHEFSLCEGGLSSPIVVSRRSSFGAVRQEAHSVAVAQES